MEADVNSLLLVSLVVGVAICIGLPAFSYIPFSVLICSLRLKLTKKALSSRCKATAAMQDNGIKGTDTFNARLARVSSFGDKDDDGLVPVDDNGATPQEIVMARIATLIMTFFHRCTLWRAFRLVGQCITCRW